MKVVARRTRRRSRPRPAAQPCPRLGSRFVVLALGVVTMLAAVPTHSRGEQGDITAGVGISIPRTVKVKLISAFAPRYATGGDETATAGAAPSAYGAEVSVVTNTADWGVVVRLALPQRGGSGPGNVAARCRLQDGDGRTVSEQFVGDGDVVLQGNGKRGSYAFLLEIDGVPDAFAMRLLTEPIVDVEGAVGAVSRAGGR